MSTDGAADDDADLRRGVRAGRVRRRGRGRRFRSVEVRVEGGAEGGGKDRER